MERGDLLPRRVGIFSQDDIVKIQRSLKEQQRLKEKIERSKCFTEQETEALALNSFDAFKMYWDKTLSEKKLFDLQHEHGSGSLGMKLDGFGASIHGVIAKLDPLIDVVRGSGVPYVDMAVGIITFCFACATNRRKMESRINLTLLTIQDRLPGLKMYDKIYQDYGVGKTMKEFAPGLVSQLESKLVDVYDSFVQFCIAAVNFYAMGSFMRRLKSLSGGLSFLEEQAARVPICVIAVKSVCEELLSLKIDASQRLNEDLTRNVHSLKAQVTDLKKKIEDLQASQDNENLEKVREALGTKIPPSVETQMQQLAQRQENIIAEFRHSYIPPYTSYQHLEKVRSHTAFLSWESSPTSCILVLAGHNQVISATHCWVSSVALDIITELVGAGPRDPLAFCSLPSRVGEDTFQQVLSFIILRLLEMNPEGLREQSQHNELFAALSEYCEAVKHSSMADQARTRWIQSLLLKVACKVLGMFDSSKTVWVVLDRLDQCRPTTTSSVRAVRTAHCKALLKALVKLVEADEVEAKLWVLVVVNGLDWNVEEEADELDADQTKRDRLIIQSFRQNERQ